MKSNKDKITVQLKGNGPAGNLLVTANNFPKLKGYVTEPHVDIPLNEFGKIDVSGGYANRKIVFCKELCLSL